MNKERVVAFLKSFEGFVPKVYDDGTGTPTIGYGFTKHWIDAYLGKGKWEQYAANGMTIEEATNILNVGVNKYEQYMSTIPGWNNMAENQREALLVFGHIRPQLTNPIKQLIMQGKYLEIPRHFGIGLNDPSRAHLKKGLLRRWNSLAHLYNTGEFDTSGKISYFNTEGDGNTNYDPKVAETIKRFGYNPYGNENEINQEQMIWRAGSPTVLSKPQDYSIPIGTLSKPNPNIHKAISQEYSKEDPTYLKMINESQPLNNIELIRKLGLGKKPVPKEPSIPNIDPRIVLRDPM